MNSIMDNLNDFNDFVVDTLPLSIVLCPVEGEALYCEYLFSNGPKHINPRDPDNSGWDQIPNPNAHTHLFTLLKDINHNNLLFTQPIRIRHDHP